MKKIVLVALCLCMAVSVGAQDVNDRAAYIFNIDHSLWYNSSSVAGLAREDMAQWRNIKASYDLANGSFTDSWDSHSRMGLSLGGDMMMELGTLKLLAGLDLERNFLGKSRYNTSLYEVSWDMPYFAAVNSDESFLWRQSHASLDLGVVTPLMLDERLSAGIAFKMDLKGATKNADPQCRYRGLGIGITPSATFAVNEENIIGLSVSFKSNSARSILSSDAPKMTALFLQGLGEYSLRWVGGDLGMAPLNYDARVLGASLQYNHIGDASDWLLELSVDKWQTSVTENDIVQGRVDKFVTGFTATGLFGQNRNRKLTASFNYNLNYWLQGVNATTVAHNGIVGGNINYTVYTGTGAGSFDWMLGMGMDLSILRLSRVNPETSFTSNRVLPYAFVGKDISISQEHSLLARLKMGYNFSNRNTFKYGGTATGNYIVNYMLDDELDYLSSYYLDTRLSLDYTYRLNTVLSPYASLSGGLLLPMERNSSRFILQLSVGVLF